MSYTTLLMQHRQLLKISTKPCYTWAIICCAVVLVLVNTVQDVDGPILVTYSLVQGNSAEEQ